MPFLNVKYLSLINAAVAISVTLFFYNPSVMDKYSKFTFFWWSLVIFRIFFVYVLIYDVLLELLDWPKNLPFPRLLLHPVPTTSCQIFCFWYLMYSFPSNLGGKSNITVVASRLVLASQWWNSAYLSYVIFAAPFRPFIYFPIPLLFLPPFSIHYCMFISLAYDWLLNEALVL